MRRFRSNTARRTDTQDTLGYALRQEFSQEIETQLDKIPSAHSILLVAKFEAQVRRQSRAGALLDWIHPLLLSTVAGLLAFWWSRMGAAPMDLAEMTEPWIQAIALAALLSAMALGWTRYCFRQAA